MQSPFGSPSIQQIARKWHDLAQRRLDYYTELYRSGRFRHYYSEERFAMRMLDVIEAARKWRGLAGLPRPERPGRPDNPENSQANAQDKVRSAA